MALFSPWGNQQFFDDNGNPATGWKIYAYAAGSSAPLATYTTEAGTVAQSNPIILNSLGFVSNPIFLTAGLAYKLVLTNASDVVKGPPVDGITGVTGTASTSQWQASGLTPTYVSATSFTLAGDQTTNFHVKRRIQSTNTAGTITSTITATAYTTLTTVTVVNDSGALDSGLSAVNLGLLTANNPSVPTSYAKSGANSDITSLGNNTSAVYTTAGTSTAYTLTPTPAITAYTAGQSFFVTFNAAPGATPTLAISGVATPPNLVKQLADGTYANIAANDFPANHRSRVTLLSASQALIETMPPVVGARCAVYVSTDQTMATALTFYTLAMDTEVYDVYSEFNTGTYTFTAKDAGKYRICATASMSLGSSGDWGEVAVYAGATRVRTARASTADSSGAKCSPQINTVLILAAGDTVTIRGQFNSGTASRSIDGAGLLGERTFMSIDRIG